MAVINPVVVMAMVVAVWVACSAVVAQSSQDGASPAATGSQDTKPLEPFTSCADMRSKLEDEFYVMYKGRLPRRMLKDLLPLFVEPLLDPECTSGGYSAWLRFYPNGDAPSRPKRAFMGLDFFMPGSGTPAKDPGDAPSGGPNPYKDPFDRMTAGLPKDPGDHPAAAASAMSRMSQMMRLAQLMSPRPQAGTNWGARVPAGPRAAPNPYQKQNRGGLYGDVLPGKRKKRASGDSGDGTDLVTIGDMTMPSDTFSKIVSPERKDRKERYRPYYPPPQPYYPPPPPQNYYPPPPPQNYYPPPQRNNYPPPQQTFYPPPQNYYPPRRQNYYQNGNGNSNQVYQNRAYQAALLAQKRRAQAQVLQRQAALAARQAQVLAMAARRNGQNGQAQPFPIFQRLQQMPYVPPPPQAPPQIYGNDLPNYMSQMNPQAAAPAIPQQSPTGARTVAGAGAAPNRRVKRASEEESSSSSDPSPADVVTFGDVVLPTDTFHKMISRPEEPRPRLPMYPPPAYYPPPPPRAYYPSPYYRANNYVSNGYQNGRNGYPPSNGYRNGRNGYPPSNGYPNGRNGYPPSNGYANGGNGYPPYNGYMPNGNGYPRANGNGFVPGSNGVPLPMGAAKPLYY